MDTSDPDITFKTDGTCNHCEKYFNKKQDFINRSTQNDRLDFIINKIKEKGKNKKYDCLIGVSGGVDSTYVAYLVKELGLRPLAIHLDNGWNSELAVKNIENTLKVLDIDLFTYVIDWEEFKDLQLSFLKASIPGMEIPTDHAITAVLYRTALKYNIKYIINGSNLSSELIMAPSWSEAIGQRDWKLIKNIQNQFGNKKLKSFPHFSMFDFFYFFGIRKLKVINILDYINYSKDDAIKLLQEKLGWKYYGGKHYESIYTRFTQGYIQPKKFKFDKRRAHFSNLICRGDISREEVLQILETSPYVSQEMLRDDTVFFKNKLSLSDSDFARILEQKTFSYKDYKGYFNSKIYVLINKWVYKLHFFIKKMKGKK